MKRGYKVLFAAEMRRFNDWLLQARIENKDWEELLPIEGSRFIEGGVK